MNIDYNNLDSNLDPTQWNIPLPIGDSDDPEKKIEEQQEEDEELTNIENRKAEDQSASNSNRPIKGHKGGGGHHVDPNPFDLFSDEASHGSGH